MFINFYIAHGLQIVLFSCTPAVWQLWLNEYVMLCYGDVLQSNITCLIFAVLVVGHIVLTRRFWLSGFFTLFVKNIANCLCVILKPVNKLLIGLRRPICVTVKPATHGPILSKEWHRPNYANSLIQLPPSKMERLINSSSEVLKRCVDAETNNNFCVCVTFYYLAWLMTQ